MVKSGATRRHSPESCTSGQSKTGDAKKVTRSRRGREPVYEDSSTMNSVGGDDSQNGNEHETGVRRTKSPAAAKLRLQEESPEESEAENSQDEDEEGDNDEGSDDGSDSDEEPELEKEIVPDKRPRGRKRKASAEESNETSPPLNGKRRQLRAKPEPKSPSRASSRSPAAMGTTSPRKGRPRRSNPIVNVDDVTKKRMNELLHSIQTYTKNGKALIEVFYGLPPKASYPDYYDVISEPIDMLIIEERVEGNRYKSERAVMYDLALLFKNARYYNEEDSPIYRDASLLEQHLKTTWSKMVAEKDEKVDPMYVLYETVFNYEDDGGRALIVPFMRLPSKQEFPNYYEMIRRPIDVARIRDRLFSESYALLDDMVADFRLLFDNSCKFNEPDSQLYRDSLVLLRICIEKRQSLLGIAPSAIVVNDPPRKNGMPPQMVTDTNQQVLEQPPDVLRGLQDMMRELLSFLHQCRCPSTDGSENSGEFYVQRLADAATAASSSTSANGLTELPPLAGLERIRQNVELGRYRRLDRFQDDVFEVLHFVRVQSQPSSVAFQASVHLQEEFIKRRDAYIECGRRLYTPASQYGLPELQADIERDIGASVTPLPNDVGYHSDEGEDDSQDGSNVASSSSTLSSVTVNGQTYVVGDYVYLKYSADQSRPRIVQIQKLWEDETSKQQMISGPVFLRPDETYHMVNRKFYPNEVFKSDTQHSGSVSAITGRCIVLLPRIFFRFKLEGLPENDAYICDTRYSSRSRLMAKIRGWKGVFVPREQSTASSDDHAEQKPSTPDQKDEVGFNVSGGIRLVRRPSPLHMARTVPSVFAVKQQEQAVASDTASSANPTQPMAAVLDKFRENVSLSEGNATIQAGENCVQLYEQLIGPPPTRVSVKLGDFVYISPQPYQTVVLRVERLFTQTSGDGSGAFVCGTRLFLLHEVVPGPHDPTSRELVISATIETHPMSRVLGRCLVLALREYCSLRCPEVLERDTFLCDSECVSAETLGMPMRLRKINSVAIPNFKRYSPNVVEDEVYFFIKPLALRKTILTGGTGHHLPLSSSSSSTCDSSGHRLPLPIPDESSSLGGADELAKMAAISGHDDFKMTNSPSSSLAHSDAPRKISGMSSHRGRGGKSSNRGNGPVSGWTVFSRYMHHDKEMARMMAGKEFPERAKMIAERWRALNAEQRAKYIEEARIEEEGRRAKRAAAAAAAAAAEAASVSSIDAARSPAPGPMMSQNVPQQPMPQQGQMMMIGPNGPMMMPPQQVVHYPDQVHHQPQMQMPPSNQMPPNMQQYGGPPGYYQRPPSSHPPQFQHPQQMPYHPPQMMTPPFHGGPVPTQQAMPQHPHGYGVHMQYVNGHPPVPPQMMHHPQVDGGQMPPNFHQPQFAHPPQYHQTAPYMQGPNQLSQPLYQQQPPQSFQQAQQSHPPYQNPQPMGFSPQQTVMPGGHSQQPHQAPPQQMIVPQPPQPLVQQPTQQHQHPQFQAPLPRAPEPSQNQLAQANSAPQDVAQLRPAAPIVHTVPPRTQRLVHSEAFLRYLDGLGAASGAANSRPFISDWPRSLNITENHISDALQNNDTRARLSSMVGPAVVSTNGVSSEESRTALVGALYKLNSSLISDSLNLSRVLDYEQL